MREAVINVSLPATMDRLVSALIDLMSDAKQMSDIAIQTGEDLRARQAEAHLLGRNAGAWSAVLQRSVAPHFDGQVDVATAALPQKMHAGGSLSTWRAAAASAHSAVMTADGAAASVVDWAQAAEAGYEEAAEEAGEIAAGFDGVSDESGSWAQAANAARHGTSVRAAVECVGAVKSWLTGQVGLVKDLYQTIAERPATLYDTVGERLHGHHFYGAHPTVAERLTGCIQLCDELARVLWSEFAPSGGQA